MLEIEANTKEEFDAFLAQVRETNNYYHVDGIALNGEKIIIEGNANDDGNFTYEEKEQTLEEVLTDNIWKVETKPTYSYSKSFDNFEDMLLSLVSVSFSVADAINPRYKRVRKRNGQVFTAQEVEEILFENAFFDAQIDYGSQLHLVRIDQDIHYTTTRNFAFGWTVENDIYTGYVSHPYRDEESFGSSNSTLEASCLVHGYELDIQK